MKRMSCFWMWVALVFACQLSCRTASAENQVPAGLQRLVEHADETVPSLWAYVRRTRTSPPLIYSQWYVDSLALKDPERAEIEQVRRDFGRTVAESLDKMASSLRGPSDSAERESQALTLLGLADWFGEQPGYGNALLFNRLQDMATVPLAYLIADLSYPQTNLTAMASRLVGFPEEVRRNTPVLNTESPEPVFSASGDTADTTVVPLERQWLQKIKELREWQAEQNKPLIVPKGRRQRDQLPAAFAFFADDDISEAPRPFTTLSQWDRKYHKRLLLGLGSHNIERVRSLLLFREKVGTFPTNPPTWWQPGDRAFPSPVIAAFSEAWRPFRSEYGSHYSFAAATYEMVQTHAFYDEDARRAMNQHAFQEANEASSSSTP